MHARHRLHGQFRVQEDVVFAGIDTHKDTLAVAVIDAAGRLLASCQEPNTEHGFARLAELFDAHQVRRIGIEGSGNYGRAVTVHLALAWSHDPLVEVVEVPTMMTSRERRGQVGRGKTDPVDALAIARITARESTCRRCG
jgi:transposase